MQSHQAMLDDFPFPSIIKIFAVGNSAGLVVLWDDNILELDYISTTNQEIHALIKVRLTQDSWLFSCIYDSNLRTYRQVLLENIKAIKDNY